MPSNDFLNLYSKYQLANLVGLEDFTDRLNRAYTVILLAFSCIIISSETYFSKSIACHMPTVPTGAAFKKYVENYCWVEGTVIVLGNESLPQKDADWKLFQETRKIRYYQWVPFMLGLQCLLFYLPYVIWRCITFNRLGSDLTALVLKASQAMHAKSIGERNKCIKSVARNLEMLLFVHRDKRRGLWGRLQRRLADVCGIVLVSKRLGTWTVFSYLCIKLLYLGNAILQLYMMQQFLSQNDSAWEFTVRMANQLIDRIDWRQSLYFPRVSFCRVPLSHLGAKRNDYIGMCALPINMYNEKLYIVLYFWVCFVTVCTLLSIPMWLIRLSTRRHRTESIFRYFLMKPLKQHNPSSDGSLLSSQLSTPDCMDFAEVMQFVTDFLRVDGVFLVHILRINAGDIITGEIVRLLWFAWSKRYAHRMDFNKDISDSDASSQSEELYEKTKNAIQPPDSNEVKQRGKKL